jgi:hypothetical protein
MAAREVKGKEKRPFTAALAFGSLTILLRQRMAALRKRGCEKP